jgi:hypothetical protein
MPMHSGAGATSPEWVLAVWKRPRIFAVSGLFERIAVLEVF